MLEGDVLVEKKLGPKGTPPGLVANIPKGMRALAIDVTEQSGVSGFILPGHHVDVVRYESSEKKRTTSTARRSCRTCWCSRPVRSSPARTSEPSSRARSPWRFLPVTSTSWSPHGRAAPSRFRCEASTTTNTVAQLKKAEPKVDSEAEKRWKLSEEARQKLETDLRLLKEELARKPAEAKVAVPRPSPRIATVYRGLHNIQRVRLDHPGVSELSPDELSVNPATGALGLQKGFRSGSLGSSDDETQP